MENQNEKQLIEQLTDKLWDFLADDENTHTVINKQEADIMMRALQERMMGILLRSGDDHNQQHPLRSQDTA